MVPGHGELRLGGRDVGRRLAFRRSFFRDGRSSGWSPGTLLLSVRSSSTLRIFGRLFVFGFFGLGLDEFEDSVEVFVAAVAVDLLRVHRVLRHSLQVQLTVVSTFACSVP